MDFSNGQRFRVIGSNWKEYPNFRPGAIVEVQKKCPYGDYSYTKDNTYCHFKLIRLPEIFYTGSTTRGRHGQDCLYMEKDQVTYICQEVERV